MQRLKDCAAAGIILLLLPYIAVLFLGNDVGEADKQEEYAGKYFILVDNGRTEEKMDLETYVQGASASVLEPDCEEEMIKAQMILVRTNLVRELGEDGTVPAGSSSLSEHYTEPESLKKRLGESFASFYEKLAEASEITRGMILTYEGKPVEAAYHGVSNGRTRSGEEVLGENYGYLQSVDSSQDIYSEDYLLRREISKTEWEGLLARAGYDGSAGFQIKERDSAGYVLRVEIGDSVVSGEGFRQLLRLNSADFTVEEREDVKIVTTKGAGHGLGMSQYGANDLALQGMDYGSILSYYFQGTELKKIE